MYLTLAVRRSYQQAVDDRHGDVELLKDFRLFLHFACLDELVETGEVKEQSEIFEEFDITMSVIDSLLIRSTDSEGKIHISWGSQRVTS